MKLTNKRTDKTKITNKNKRINKSKTSKSKLFIYKTKKTIRKLKGGNETNDTYITKFVDYLANDDRDLISKCSSDNSFKKFFIDQRTCELFSLNVLGKVSIFKNLYNYSKKIGNNTDLSPEQIQRISQLMERRCDQENLPNLNSPIHETNKEIVIQIIESVYSSDNLMKEFTNFQEQINNNVISNENSNEISNQNSDETIVKEVSEIIKSILYSYYGFDSNIDCTKAKKMMGLLKGLFVFTNKNVKDYFTLDIEKIKEKIIVQIIELIDVIQSNNHNGAGMQHGGGLLKKLQNLLKHDFFDDPTGYLNKINTQKGKVPKFFKDALIFLGIILIGFTPVGLPFIFIKLYKDKIIKKEL